MTTNVDSRSDDELLAASAGWLDCSSLRELDSARLQAVTAEHGIDFATALLYDRANKALREKTGSTADELLHASAHAKYESDKPRIVLIPGAFHELPQFNSVGRTIQQHAQALGMPTATIPIQSFGSLQTNATIIRDWLRQADERPIFLVTLSKGGADLKHALLETSSDPVWSKVQGWLNFSGICEGTPLANWLTDRWYRPLLVRLYFAWCGYVYKTIHDLKYSATAPLNDQLRLPEHWSAIHVLGFPRFRHLSSNMARRGHRRLAKFGPNDGSGIVLETAVRRPGLIFPLWGVDHFLQHDRHSVATIFQTALHLGRMTQVQRQLPCEVCG